MSEIEEMVSGAMSEVLEGRTGGMAYHPQVSVEAEASLLVLLCEVVTMEATFHSGLESSKQGFVE